MEFNSRSREAARRGSLMLSRVLVDEPSLLIEETDTALFMTGVIVEIRQENVPGDKDLVVRAYEVVLPTSLIAPGRSLSIACRRLRCTASVVLDVSGKDAIANVLPAMDGRQPGQPGEPGLSGERGENAGSILIVASEIVGQLHCRANGGDGAPGQNGGNGAIGAAGPDGQDAELRPHGRPAEPGHPGGRGGDAGAGGIGGPGGDAGNVDLILSLPPLLVVEIEAMPGLGLRAGDPGRPGGGGPGGRGGRRVFCTPEPGPRP